MIKGKISPFVTIKIDKDMVTRSLSKAEEMGRLRNSITGGEKNVFGFLGEEIVSKYLGCSMANTYEYDLICGDKFLEIKTKDTTAYPKGGYEVSVAEYNTKQRCDHYVFTRILTDMSMGWILGYMPKEEYFYRARKLVEGEMDGTNNFIVKADCWNMYISDLKPINELL